MDDLSRGIATAALTLKSVLLQALVHKGVITRADALGVVDRSIEAVATAPSAEDEGELVELTQDLLAGVREGLVAMPERQ
jgi:hypothetical protein